MKYDINVTHTNGKRRTLRAVNDHSNDVCFKYTDGTTWWVFPLVNVREVSASTHNMGTV